MSLAAVAALVCAAVALALLAGLVVARSRARIAAAEMDRIRADRDRTRRELEATRAEAALRERILSAMDEGVLLAAGRDIVYANPAAARLLDAAPRSLPPWIPPPVGPDPQTSRVTLHHPRRREIRLMTAALGEDGVLVVLQDVTDEARLEGARRDLVANASHEMKTPVAAILATAETLVAAIRDDLEAAPRFADTLVQEARGLSDLLQSLLDLARLDQPPPPPEAVRVSEIVADAVEAARPLAEAAGLRLDADVSPSLTVKGGADDLALLVRNLVDNALRYTPSGGTVSVSLSATPAGLRLDVRDTGIGIPSKDLPHVFERFYRVDRARARATGGTGLGLAIVRAVAEAHGADVVAHSELGRGSTFTVRFPA